MCKDMSPLEKAIQFHGHICPGLLMGVRAAELALEYLQVDLDQDDDLAAIVETNFCGVDAIQAILGCTFGKGNLYFRDYGKIVYTIFSRKKQQAIRIAQRFEALDDPNTKRYLALRFQEQLTTEEEAELEDLLALSFEWIMSQPLERLFHWRQVDVPELNKAEITPSVQCHKCGEGVLKNNAVLTDDSLLCPECRLSMEG